MCKKAWIAGQIYSITGEGFTPEGKVIAVESLDVAEGSLVAPNTVSQFETPALCKSDFFI